MKDSFEFMRMSAAMRHHLLNEEAEKTEAAHAPVNKSDTSIHRFPLKTPIGMTYVPVQQWGETYKVEEAFDRGTLFPELDFPFGGGDCGYE